MSSITGVSHSAGVIKYALISRRDIAKINDYFSQFQNNNFVNIDNFVKLVRDAQLHLENIQHLVLREEEQQLYSMERWIRHFFDEHALERIEKKEKEQVIDLFKRTLNVVMDDFRKELSSEKQVGHHHMPRIPFLKRFKSSSSLDRQIVHDEKTFDHLLSQTHTLSGNLMKHANQLSRGVTDPNLTNLFIHEVTLLCFNLRKEFSLLLDEALDVQIQEADIINELDNLISSGRLQDSAVVHKLKQLRSDLIHRIKMDVNYQRILFKRATGDVSYIKHV